MSEKVYVVTLYNREDLEDFYTEMAENGFRLSKKRPISRNTHYWMTESQAEELKLDPRVWGVASVDSFIPRRQVVNNEPYAVTGNFWKADTQPPAQVSPNDYQWGHIHCAGGDPERGKNQFGPIAAGWTYEQVNDSVEVFNNGRHVDVVICDDPISYDSQEWYSPSSNQTRFVQYQWFNELNTLVNTIDDDGQTEPTGTITYGTNATTTQFHGNHVCGTVAGQHYGWAREANIYNMAITDPWPSGQQFPALLIFDYLRAFHQSKPINSTTGKRNPTITNHSYGGVIPMSTDTELLTFADLTQVNYQGVTYNSGNPGPSGWTEAGVTTDFGVRFGVDVYPAWSSAVNADIQDAIDDGVVIIGAAGNDNLLFADPSGANWNNTLTVSGVGTFYYMRGGWPNSPDSGSINVGAMSFEGDFRRAVFTNFGPAIDVFAPGENILSAYGNQGGLNDTKYTLGSANYFYPISGTSMASPQVAGVIACLASGKDRFTQDDAIGYIQQNSKTGDMTFDVSGGGFNDSSARGGSPNRYLLAKNPRPEAGQLATTVGKRFNGQTFPRRRIVFSGAVASQTYTFSVTGPSNSNYAVTGTDASGTFNNALDPQLQCSAGDTLVFNVNALGHPFWIKTAATTGTGNQVTQGVTGAGTQSGTVTWDTTGITPGTYYYICQFHSLMYGEIVIS